MKIIKAEVIGLKAARVAKKKETQPASPQQEKKTFPPPQPHRGKQGAQVKVKGAQGGICLFDVAAFPVGKFSLLPNRKLTLRLEDFVLEILKVTQRMLLQFRKGEGA